ncbi:NAD-dependent epimerase/dehydratase family protein [Pseudomonadota bacterium]|nr:NAD-dependent epimerase/dehydratase family protein [Pseudomonadota bacterium]
MKILVTGVAGFIGFHLARKLILANQTIVGLDDLNNYYDEDLKQARLSKLLEIGLIFKKIDISNKNLLDNFLLKNNFDIIIHLAAQAGVRYSIENPQAYINSNINGFFNILEGARKTELKHLIYASSSSVYGGNFLTPFQESQKTDTPQNLYAASKKSNELMSYSYSNLFKIPTTGLRFFTVYGPWGRPDMAYFKFVKNIFEGKPIEIYGNGEMYRDFTYIDDVVNGILEVLDRGPTKINIDNYENDVPWEIFNIGNNKVVSLEEFITIIENCIGKKATKKYLDMQPGDMRLTFANIDKIKNSLDFAPLTSINKGLLEFIKWYKSFYKIV